MNLVSLISSLFGLYFWLIFIRVILSWVSSLQSTLIYKFVYEVTEPYISFFRSFIPPIGGMIDMSPFIAGISLQIIQRILLGLIQ